jgi:hypothetical protein
MSGGSQKRKSRKKALVCGAVVIVGVLVFGAFRLAKSAVSSWTTWKSRAR